MQIDFHHAATYVAARLAGFGHNEADIIAYSAQFVDDAVDSGIISFDNESMFEYISSAHKMLDYRNFKKLANHHVWIPFHFLPANDIDPKLKSVIPDFVQQAICRPDSQPAREMLRHTIDSANHPNGLYRLGIAMHVYADTWAHQGFAGISHKVNTVQSICDHKGKPDEAIHQRLKVTYGENWFERVKGHIESSLLNEFAPLGHGPVLSYPDHPFRVWSYVDWRGEQVERNNPKDYLEAFQHLYIAMSRYIRQDPKATVMPIHANDKAVLKELIETNIDESGELRHQVWLDEISKGQFSFGKARPEYKAVGEGSWRHQVFPEIEEDQTITEWLENNNSDGKVSFKQDFIYSHWKQFHDALLCHRASILHEVLPIYGIMAA